MKNCHPTGWQFSARQKSPITIDIVLLRMGGRLCPPGRVQLILRKAARRACGFPGSGGLAEHRFRRTGGAKRLYRPGQTAAADSVRPPAPYHPCLRRIPRRQRRHRAGLLSAGNKVTIHWIFSENAGTDKFVRPFQAGAETYENGLF